MVRGTPLAAFLTTGQSHADPDQLLDALTGWTRTTADELPEPSRLLLRLLAAAEPEHRTSDMLKGVWTDLWRRLGRSSVPPPLSDTLAPLTAAALVEVEPAGDPGDPDRADRYNLHPGVADVICAGISPQTLTTIDNQLARFWVRLLDEGYEKRNGKRLGGSLCTPHSPPRHTCSASKIGQSPGCCSSKH